MNRGSRPSAGGRAAGAPLRERDADLAVLDDGLASARRGEGRLVLVGGEAGIGKSALVQTFCAGVRGARVLVGACDALATPRPLGPVRDILDHLPRAAPAGDESREQLFRRFLDELADPGWPTVAVIEDAHWADEATADCLRFVGRRVQATRSLVVVTFRSDELDAAHPLRAVAGDLASTAGVVRLDLAALSRRAVGGLAAEATTSHLDVDALCRATGGNPFYVTEVIAAGGGSVPASVRDAVLARTARLPAGARSVIEAAAVAPTRIEVWLLQALAEAADDDVDACVAAGVLRADEPGTLAFRHELARLAIAGTLSPSRSAGLHARAAACILDRYADAADPARVAHHAEHAGDAPLTRTHATLAAVRAAAVGSHREAASQYERALHHAHDLPPGRLAELLEGYAVEVGLTDRADAMLAAASRAVRLRRAAGELLRLGAALRLEASALWSAGRSVDAGKVGLDAVETLEPLGQTEELADAYAFMATHAMLSREHQATLDWGAKAITLASRIDSAGALVRSLNSVGSSKLVVGDATGRDDLRRSIDIATRTGLDNAVARGWSNLGSGSGEIRDHDVAEHALREAIAFAAANDLDAIRNYATAWLARVRFELGDWDEAASLASALTSDMAPITRIVALTVLGRLAARRGEPGARAAMDEAWSLATVTEDLQRLWPTAAARAELAWLGGDPESISGLVDAVLDQAIDHQHAWAIGELGLWRWRAGDDTPPHPRAAEPYALHVSGRLSEAAALWRELGCPYEAADALSDSDQPDELRDALAVLDSLGAAAAAHASGGGSVRSASEASRGARDPRAVRTRRGSPAVSRRCWRSSRSDSATPTSPNDFTCPPRPSATTCPRSSPSWVSPRAARPPTAPAKKASSRWRATSRGQPRDSSRCDARPSSVASSCTPQATGEGTLRTRTRITAAAASAGGLLLLGFPAAASPTCSDFEGLDSQVHAQHIVRDYVTGGSATTWPPSGVGSAIGGTGAAVRGGPGPGFHFPNGFAPGASFCLAQAKSPGFHADHP